MKKLTIIILAALSLSAVSAVWLSSCAGTPAAGSGKPVILAVSFGTSFNESREKTIGAIEKAIAAAYPAYEVRRAFTSQIIIDRVAERDGIKIDNVDDAMKRLKADKVKELVVQPTHIMNGLEYDEMIAAIKPYEKNFTSVRYGRPLLSSDNDFADVVSALADGTKQYAADNDTAVVFMGHGTEHNANEVYTKLAGLLKAQGLGRYLVGTVEAEPSLDDVADGLKSLGVKKAVLFPFMIVAGDHATNDMAGDEDDSWRSILEAEGYAVTAVLKGLGEYPEIQGIFVRHAGDAIGQ
jgi:sirohydrochlorin cobaltochelatase